MVDMNDLYKIAEAMDKQMMALNMKERRDFRRTTTIQMELPKLNLQAIDETLYERENHTMVGYEPGDEVDVNIIGISFKLVKKKEAE